MSISRIVTLGLFALLAGCSIDNALVGGQCRDGFTFDGSACVPSANVTPPPVEPPDATASADGSVAMPEDGGTAPVPDASAADADASDLDASVPDASGPDASEPDASEPDASEPDASEPDASEPDAPLVCSSPLVACGDVCIPVDSDEANCGACGKVCPSNICATGECVGSTPGDVVVVGHAFASSSSDSPQAHILFNALAIPTTNPIRVLAWESGASSGDVVAVRAMLAGGIRGRGVQLTAASDATDLESATLSLSYDVVLLHDASGSTPAALGASWASALTTFTQKGGVVVALDGAGSSMPQLMTSAGLLAVSGHTLLSGGAHLLVTAPADVVGTQVLSPYAAAGAAVTFQGAPAQGSELTWVVRDETTSDPVVIHRIVR